MTPTRRHPAALLVTVLKPNPPSRDPGLESREGDLKKNMRMRAIEVFGIRPI